MSLIGSFTKQPAEDLPFDINYASVIGGRTVTSITPTVTVPAGMTKPAELLSGQVFQIYVASGTTATSYRWVVTTAIVIGGLTTRVQDEIDVVVLEV